MRKTSKKKETEGIIYYTSSSKETFAILEMSYGTEISVKIAAETSMGTGASSDMVTIFIGKIILCFYLVFYDEPSCALLMFTMRLVSLRGHFHSSQSINNCIPIRRLKLCRLLS